jgi:hypothetical protein
MKTCLLAVCLSLVAAPGLAKSHGGGHGGGGHSAVAVCAGCEHRQLCRFEEIIALKASCFGLDEKRKPAPSSAARANGAVAR